MNTKVDSRRLSYQHFAQLGGQNIEFHFIVYLI